MRDLKRTIKEREKLIEERDRAEAEVNEDSDREVAHIHEAAADLLRICSKATEAARHFTVTETTEITENEFNLNLPRYVDTFDPEKLIDLREALEATRAAKTKADRALAALGSLLKDSAGKREGPRMITDRARTILREIPADWDTTDLKEVLEHHRSGEWGEERGGVERKILRSTNFTDGGQLNFDDVAHRFLTQASGSRLELKKGDLLLERSGGGPSQPVGRIAFVQSDLPGCAFSNFVQVLRPNQEKIDPGFLGWALFELNRSGVAERLQHQTTQMRNLEYRDYLRVSA